MVWQFYILTKTTLLANIINRIKFSKYLRNRTKLGFVAFPKKLSSAISLPKFPWLIGYFHDHAQCATFTVLSGHRFKNPTESCDPDKTVRNKHSAQ